MFKNKVASAHKGSKFGTSNVVPMQVVTANIWEEQNRDQLLKM